MDTSRRIRTEANAFDAASADNNLSFVLRQAALRCIERHRQKRAKPLDVLLLLFAHYFAEAHDLPFVKLLLDARATAPKPRPYQAPHEFIVSHLLHDDANDEDEGNAAASQQRRWTHADIRTCLEEAKVIADAVDADSESLRELRRAEAVRRATQQKQEGQQQAEEEAASEDEEVLSKERALMLTSYFRIFLDVLESGLAVVSALRTLHPRVADEAASLVARAGPQLPRAIATMEALSWSEAPGVDCAFYAAVAKIGKLLLARQRADEYVEQFRNEVDDGPDPEDEDDNNTAGGNADKAGADEQARRRRQQLEDPNALQTEEQVERLMERAGERLEADEHAFNDEVLLQQQGATATRPATDGNQQQQPKLIKPERFAKVITGYNWSNYNKAHFTFEQPPPKTVQAYEFTLFYPDMVNPQKRTPTFKVIPTDDEYCYIEFDAGPPYQKVTYRIVNREWDPKRLKATFDPSGRFKLYFKLRTMVYRR